MLKFFTYYKTLRSYRQFWKTMDLWPKLLEQPIADKFYTLVVNESRSLTALLC